MLKMALTLAAALCATAAAAQTVRLTSLDGSSKILTMADVAAMPHEAVTLHTEAGQAIEYRGVALATVLESVGAPLGKAMRGKEMADIVVVTARDGYRVVLALSDIDPAMRDEKVILADSAAGASLNEHDGPLRLVVEGDHRPARSERMVSDIAIVRAPAP
jgi:hypothetical protein